MPPSREEPEREPRFAEGSWGYPASPVSWGAYCAWLTVDMLKSGTRNAGVAVRGK